MSATRYPLAGTGYRDERYRHHPPPAQGNTFPVFLTVPALIGGSDRQVDTCPRGAWARITVTHRRT